MGIQLIRRVRGMLACLTILALAQIPGAGCSKNKSTTPVSVPSITQSMVLVHSGGFRMGSPTDEPGRQADEVRHTVHLSRPFWLLDHEVTQAEWQAVMVGNPSFFRDPSLPVENITWSDAVAFCNFLSLSHSLTPAYTVGPDSVRWDPTANGFRLPTEAEWERACRAGTSTAFCDGPIVHPGADCYSDANLEPVAWYCANYGSGSHEVRLKAANGWGLHDMHGNVWEWCWDWYAAYDTLNSVDPRGPASSSGDSLRVLRGGSWGSEARYCRSAVRWDRKPTVADNTAGVRLAINAAAADSDTARFVLPSPAAR